MDLSDLAFRITELERLIANVAKKGTVAAVDADAGKIKVQCGDLLTGWISIGAARAGGDRSWSCPEVGEQIALIAPGGDLSQAVPVRSLYRDAHPAPAASTDITRWVFADGLVIEHDRTRNWTKLEAIAAGTLELNFKNIILRTGDEGFILFDHAGKATLLRHKGGNLFESESWQQGAVVTGLPEHGFHPPKVENPA